MKADSLNSAPVALLLNILVPLVFLYIQPSFAAEKGFEIVPDKWVHPDSSVTVKLGPEVDPTDKMFLRLSGRTIIRDFPLDSDQMHRRIIVVKIPAPMRAGNYETSLIDQDGKELVHGPGLRVASSEQPVITKIVPIASYATNGRYDFDIVGENFGGDARGIKILINDTVFRFENPLQEYGGKTSIKDCGENVPCLIWGWKKLSIRGFSLKGQHIVRPMTVSVEIDGLESNRKPLVLSPVDRAMPGVIAFAVLGVFTGLVYLLSRRNAAQYQVNGQSYNTMAYIFIDPETNTYSLSRLQLILWSAAAVVAYTYLAASRSLVQWDWALCEFPENLPTLLGISAGTTALSLGATGMRGSKGAGPIHPDPGDFITSGGVFAPERLQFFLWTVIGVFGFISATLAQDPATVTELPKIPDSFIPLMGLSSLGYLAGKVARKPGPIISQINPPLYAAAGTSLHIIGENLSPRAQVRLNGELLQKAEIAAGSTSQADAEFVTELVVTPTAVVPAPSGATVVKVINPDGQSAEK